MSELDQIEMERQEAGGIGQQFICRASKKNHEGMVLLAKEFNDIFRKHGEYFQLSNDGDMAVFTNDCRDSWVNLQTFRHYRIPLVWVPDRRRNLKKDSEEVE